MNKGQYYRLFLFAGTATPKAIAAAKDMTLHLSAQTEESSTKDTTGDTLEYEVVGQSYEITGSALVLTDSDVFITGGTGVNPANGVNDLLTKIGDIELSWIIALCEGANNRTVTTPLFSGTCKLTNLQINAQNKQNATYSYTLTGFGEIEVEELESEGD